jgi:hypothetical protein
MIRMLWASAAALLAIGSGSQAAAAIVTFEEWPVGTVFTQTPGSPQPLPLGISIGGVVQEDPSGNNYVLLTGTPVIRVGLGYSSPLGPAAFEPYDRYLITSFDVMPLSDIVIIDGRSPLTGGGFTRVLPAGAWATVLTNGSDRAPPRNIGWAYTYGVGFQNLVYGQPVALRIDNIVYSVTTGPGVPEPATWAMMITGFGLTGAALRRRRRAGARVA